MNRTFRLLLFVLGAAVGISSCAGDEAEPDRGRAFDEVFELVETITLEEIPDTGHIAEITDFDEDGKGGYVVTDSKISRLRFFDREGRLINTIGGEGSGPGELKHPNDAAVSENGFIYVAEGGNPRLSIFDERGRYLGQRTIAAWLTSEVEALPHGVLVGLGSEGFQYAILSDSSVEAELHPRNPLVMSVPYWSNFVRDFAAVLGEDIIVASSFFYPLERYTLAGEHVGPWGGPPASWIPPTKPERGQFVGPRGIEKTREWMAGFTVITGIEAYRHQRLIVQHGRHAPDVMNLFAREFGNIDIYDRSGRKIFEDVPSPGRVLRAGEHVYILLAEPPDPWTIGIYDLR